VSKLSARLLAAHTAGDKNALVGLYGEAAEQAVSPDETAFFLTQSYIFALELGHKACGGLRERLVELGRESAQP